MKYSSIALVLAPFAVVFALSCASAQHDAAGDSSADAGASASPPGPQPDFGPLVRAPDPPPPISGGTLAVAPDGKTAVAADSDRDRVYLVDLPSRSVKFTVQLAAHAEPGRVTFDDAGHAYVILRRAGGVAVIDLATGRQTPRVACETPRGIAYDKSAAAVHVACASGELVTLPVSGGDATRRDLGKDLRDVVVLGDGVVRVSRFRAASIVSVGSSGTTTEDPLVGANLAWRSLPAPSADPACTSDCQATAVVSQEPSPEPVNPQPGGYGGSGSGQDGECAPSGIVQTRLTLVGSGSVRLPEAVLPVDLATNGREFVIVAAGNAFTRDLPQLFVVFTEALRHGAQGCSPTVHGNVPGQAVAAAFDGDDELIVQTREPAALHIMTVDRERPWKTIPLASDSRLDTGHSIFHSNAGGFLACASCHAEGAEDGRVWDFVGMGPRRTPSLLGTVQDTQPYHWDGEMKDLRDLVDHVFVERMSGPPVDDGQLDVLRGWLFAQPAPKPLHAQDAQTERGAVLFGQRCTGCHAGPRMTNNQTVDIGTGGGFQVPSLVGVGWRAPYLHSGCAKTLADRFNPACGGTGHAVTQDLLPDQISDIIAFLETL